MKKCLVSVILLAVLLFSYGSALAQDYLFSLPTYIINVYWNEDGTMAIDYLFDFANSPRGAAIEFVDVGIPNGNFRDGDIFADVNGMPAAYVSRSEYEGDGTGVAVALGRNAIPPGGRGQVHVFISRVSGVLHQDTEGDEYVSAVFDTTYFGSRFVEGNSDLTVTFHLPPGVQPEEPRWHSAPQGFPAEPQTGFDEDGRIIYTWHSQQARPDRQYKFGASFPARYVPEQAIARPSPFAFLGAIDFSCLIPFFCLGFFGLIIFIGVFSERRRKLQYLPPKLAIEGHGIKRGLTAVEAAILMEQPVDKVLTMILFGVIKKGAAQVTSRDPLRLDVIEPLTEDLRPYEEEFLSAFLTSNERERQRELQDMMVSLVKSVSQKMKGFSQRETLAYYQDIMKRAWTQVESAETPEVKSQKFDENMEWTMLDREFPDRTRDVFRHGPVFIPTWWGRYDPTFGRSTPSTTTTPTSLPGTPGTGKSGGGFSLPNLPGSEFAASMVGGMQTFSSKVVGNLSDFTGKITNQTNPPPPPPKSSGSFRGGGGGGGCACACACAGCACACAGGGR
jgi:hypothetical protein